MEWLAEWSREYRKRQQGLLLTSAHRAKGLEFDHALVLDGGWGQRDAREDEDAALRQFYVAMTRARETLTLIQMGGQHPFLDVLKNCPSVYHRTCAAPQPVSDAAKIRHLQLELSEVNLGFPGCRGKDHRIHASIRALAAGDELVVRHAAGERIRLCDAKGVEVTRLANKFTAPDGMVCCRAEVFAVVIWTKEISNMENRDQMRCDDWEVIVPRLQFKPAQSR